MTLLAARAWLAAGEPGHARHFAKRLVEGLAAPPGLRRTAAEILEATPPSSDSLTPPPTMPFLLTRPREPPTLPRMRAATLLFPQTARDEPPQDCWIAPDPPAASEPHLEVVDPDTLPRLLTASRLPASPPVSARHARPEIVETLALPRGARKRCSPPRTSRAMRCARASP